MGLTSADREFFKKQKSFLDFEKEKGNTFFDKDSIDTMDRDWETHRHVILPPFHNNRFYARRPVP